MAQNTPDEEERLAADVVVVGAGGAGLPAALAAAEEGARVVVLEKRGVHGGNFGLAWGPFAAESPVQKRAFIDARRDDLFKIAMDWAHWKIDPRLMRAYIDRSGDTIRWLEDKGLRFRCYPMAPNQTPATWHVAEGKGPAMVKTLVKACATRGVDLRRHTPVTQIVRGPDGGVAGVIAETKGRPIRVDASTAIIGTGGYGGNAEMLKTYCGHYPEGIHCEGIPHAGDGFALAQQMGAAVAGLGILQMSGPSVPGPVGLDVDSPVGRVRFMLMGVACEPQTLWVNNRGMRFVDEAVGFNHYQCGNPVSRQPGNVVYTLFDGSIAREMEEQGLILGMGTPTGAVGNPLPGFQDELRRLVGKGWVKVADSLDEMAAWIGAEPARLRATVDEYNAACAGRRDPLFAKDSYYLRPLTNPPYFAVRAHANFLTTTGGIKIDERMQVLGADDEPIPGLYAGGADVGGWNSDTYCAALPGTALGFAINSGRIAGENAARRALGR